MPPSGSAAITTTGNAPPAQARSTRRRTFGVPSTSRRAVSGEAARMQAATVTPAMLAGSRGPTSHLCDNRTAHDRYETSTPHARRDRRAA